LCYKKFCLRKELISADKIVKHDDRVLILDNLINEVNTLYGNIFTGKDNTNATE